MRTNSINKHDRLRHFFHNAQLTGESWCRHPVDIVSEDPRSPRCEAPSIMTLGNIWMRISKIDHFIVRIAPRAARRW